MLKNAARIGVGVAISAALLAWVLSRIDLAPVAGRLLDVEPLHLLAAFALSWIVLLGRALRFAWLGGTPRGTTFAATAVQNFLNRVTPLRLGELSLPWLLAKHAGADAARIVLDVLLVRLVDLGLVLAAVAAAAALRASEDDGRMLLASASITVAVVVAILLLRPLLRGASSLVASIARRLSLPRIERVSQRLHAAAVESARLSLSARAALATGSVLLFGLQGAMFAELLATWHVHLPLAAVVQGSSVAQLGAALPIGGVGIVGTLEASWTLGFQWVGVSTADAVLTAVGCQLATLAFAALQALLGQWLLLRRAR